MASKSKRILGITTLVLGIAAIPILWLQRWNVYDIFRLRGYNPPVQISQLATDTTMVNATRRVFYVNHPDLEDKTTFNGHCTDSEKTIVLGCFAPGRGIYLYNVTEPRLQGILEVTAAHETLHAIYERLDASEKKHVNILILQAYDSVKDQRIRATIEDYRTHGADTTNELHSILGTEVRSLPPELEQYYSHYFTNRLKIVEFSEKYEQEFTLRKQQVVDADLKLQELKQQIDQAQNNLIAQKTTLDNSRERLDALKAAKEFEAYNQNVPGYNSQVTAYNFEVKRIGRLIDQYNTLVAQRNAIAVEEGELIKAIDSRPDAVQGQ